MLQKIRVAIRPLPHDGRQQSVRSLMTIDHQNNVISLAKNDSLQKQSYLKHRNNEVRCFALNKIFLEDDSQETVYEDCAFNLVQNVLDGYNGTILAYGQTGSGKTYTMMGDNSYFQLKENNTHQKKILFQQVEQLRGIIPRSFQQIIAITKTRKDKKHLIQCSFIEIYNQNVHDLLAENLKANLHLKQSSSNGLVLQNLTKIIVKSTEEMEKILYKGYRNRSVRQTTMNKSSSRSHCIFTIRIEEESKDEVGKARFKVGKLNLVDLAGSQRQSKTIIASEQGLKQAVKINLSLSALGKVINYLSDFKEGNIKYIPYRDSKLTRLLQDSLGGNTKTVMIATISKLSANYQETLSTLIYASRAKFIHNTPIINEDPKDVLLRQYAEEIKRLKMLLEQREEQHLATTDMFAQSSKKQIYDPSHQNSESQIKKQIQDLQNIVNKPDSEMDESDKEQLEKIQNLKQKLTIQEEKEIQLQKRQREREKQILHIENDYNSLNEEVDNLRGKFVGIRTKYLQKCEEFLEIKKEQQQERQDFDELLRSKEREIKKYHAILGMIMEKKSLNNIIEEEEKLESSYQDAINSIKVHKKAQVIFQKQRKLPSKSRSSTKLKEIHIQPPKQKFLNIQKQRIYSKESHQQKKIVSKLNPFGLYSIKSKSLQKKIVLKSPKKRSIERQSYHSLQKYDKKQVFLPQINTKYQSTNESEEEMPSRSARFNTLDLAKIRDQIVNQIRENRKNRSDQSD